MDLHVNERHKIRHYRGRSTEERRRRMPNRDFLTSRGAYVNLRYIAMLYTYSIGNRRRTGWWCLKCVIVNLARDIPAFVTYCAYGESRSSLLIESMIN